MSDSDTLPAGAPLAARQVAELVGGRLEGDPEVEIRGIGDLRLAASHEAAFHHPKRKVEDARSSAAGLLLLADGIDVGGRPCVRVENPALAAARLARHFHPGPARPPAGVHPDASVSEDARVSEDASIGPGCVVGAGAEIASGVVLVANVSVGEEAVIGEGSFLHPGVVLYHGTKVGRDCEIHANTVIGSDGFGYVWDGERHVKVPQIGIVDIGDRVHIGSCCAIDRATFGATRIGNGCIIDNQVQIGHNCVLEDNVVLCGQVGLSGSTIVEKGVLMAGRASSGGHLTVGAGAVVTGQSALGNDVAPGLMVAGIPAWEYTMEQRARAMYRKHAKDSLRRKK